MAPVKTEQPWCKLKELVIRGKHDSLVVNPFVVPDAALSGPKHRLSLDDLEDQRVKIILAWILGEER